MSYAVRMDGQGWRAVNGQDDIAPDEYWSAEQPAVAVPSPQELIALKLAPVKSLRETAINRINGIADREQRAGNSTIRAVGDSVVLALLAMTKGLPAEPEQVDGVIRQRYAAIVEPLAQSAPELLSAFADMDQ